MEYTSYKQPDGQTTSPHLHPQWRVSMYFVEAPITFLNSDSSLDTGMAIDTWVDQASQPPRSPSSLYTRNIINPLRTTSCPWSCRGLEEWAWTVQLNRRLWHQYDGQYSPLLYQNTSCSGDIATDFPYHITPLSRTSNPRARRRILSNSDNWEQEYITGKRMRVDWDREVKDFLSWVVGALLADNWALLEDFLG